MLIFFFFDANRFVSREGGTRIGFGTDYLPPFFLLVRHRYVTGVLLEIQHQEGKINLRRENMSSIDCDISVLSGTGLRLGENGTSLQSNP